jgi:hypothetical protein
MRREVNPRLSYKRYTIQFLSELSRAVGIEKKFIDMTRDDWIGWVIYSISGSLIRHTLL